MTTYLEQYALLSNQTLFEKTHQAVVKVALDIAAEAASAEHHEVRVRYAASVLRDPGTYARSLLPGVVADGTTDGSVSDSNLYNRLAAIWNAYAGVVTVA